MEAPDLILTGARILTMDPARARAESVALRGGRIVALGSRAQIEPLAGPQTTMRDLNGATVMPGFFESHMHLMLGGAQLAHLQIGTVSGADALTRAFRTFAAQHPDRPLLMAQGGNYGLLGHPMTRHDLDAVIGDRPIAITAPDQHTVWANTVALKAAKLLHGAKTPAGHEVVMGDDGLATGELREFEAFSPIIALAGETRVNLGIATGRDPSPWPDDAARAIDRAIAARGLAHCARHGITSIVNMDGNRYTLAILDELRSEGGLTARVKVPFHMKPEMTLADLDEASAMHRDYADDWLTSGFVKLFMDGVLDSGTAYRLDGAGAAPLFSAAEFARIATDLDRRGLQIAVHAIGDGAVRQTLDGYEAARRTNGPRDSRHRIEHIEMIDPADRSRLADLGVTASLQPSHAPGAMDFDLGTLDLFSADRLGDIFLCRTLVEGGAPLCFASDWPVADVSVLRSVKAAMTRPAFGSAPHQRMGLDATLAAYTCGGAWAAHRDHITGRLAVGMAADLVALNTDIEATAAASIDALSVDLTIAGGRVTYDRAAG